MPFPSLAAIRASYSLLQNGRTEPLTIHLQALIRHLHTALLSTISRYPQETRKLPLLSTATECPESPIFSLLTEHPRSLAKYCQDGGFVVRAVVPPTVPTRRVRVCLHAGNSFEEVERLVARIEEWVAAKVATEKPEKPEKAVEQRGDLVKARM
jgi:8-amino-7-oxononanoate synthase